MYCRHCHHLEVDHVEGKCLFDAASFEKGGFYKVTRIDTGETVLVDTKLQARLIRKAHGAVIQGPDGKRVR